MQQLSAEPEFSVSKSLVDWLLADEPSVQYFALTGLLGRSENDPDVRKSRESIGKKGWAALLLQKQKDGKYWENPESCYTPKWASTTWAVDRPCRPWRSRGGQTDPQFHRTFLGTAQR